MSAGVYDEKTRERWLADFTVWAASEGFDVSAYFEDGVMYFFKPDVEKLLLAYIVGRLHQKGGA